ncbi:DEAD/DEAH box helicase [Brevundimonas sp.]|uniref:DEAD/DEAH box helicase n=1 Tax=Brevundimonas sp. TaxID=1871086 RepID=UPI002FC6FACD
MSDFRTLLKSFRDAAKSEREKGNYFERIAVDFIKNDPGMNQEYEDAWLFSDWAKTNGVDGRDTGIDAVAKLRDDGGYCAIQCKFYREGHRIAKADIDSFFTASGKQPFVRRLIIDTTDVPWSNHAEDALDGQQIPTTRIGLDRLSDSPINWAAYLHEEKIEVAPKKQLRPHQQEALNCVRDGLAEVDRGKLIMACGTGKTFTGLKIAEAMVGKGKSVLFLVPSLSLMSQTIREWTIDSETPLASFAVCSDVQVGKRRKSMDDVAEVEAHDLDYPATTNPAKLAAKVAKAVPDRMTAVFATYQSLPVVAAAQSQHGMAEFDLIICDEAHRTTGASFPGQEDSNFIKVHDQSFIQGMKRVYMTATPRVFGDSVKGKAADASVELCSMDDESMFGPTLFARGFGWAVENQLLTDYKVIVLAVDEAMVSSSMQRRLADGSSELKLDDATKIIGCYKALTKNGLSADVAADPEPMQRALAFCKDIASSKLIKDEFAAVIRDYLASEEGQETEAGRSPLGCELQHVDGTYNAKERTRALDWLKQDTGGEVCRILTNARCLSEGVDVPALDAILFMHPRKSQIDVVQSVGRVMRRAEGKRMGYIILPIGVPAGMTPEEALKDNERYRVVWDILNALRSHDERFDSTINKMGLGVDVSDHIEVVAVTNKLPTKAGATKGKSNIGQGSAADGDDDGDTPLREVSDTQAEFIFDDEFAKAIMAKIVKKCGKRDYWEDWATDIAKIAQTHITRITTTVAKEGSKEREAFGSFLAEIRDDLNDSISEPEAIEMLAQHIITKPVFEALFEDHSFARNNPVSVAMQSVLDVLQEQNLEKEAEALQNFYDSVRRRAAGIDSAEAKQRIIVELYDKFFRKAFPRMTEKLGIVYTPVEIVDFIIRSVDEVLRAEFGQNLGSEGVHIIDPFTGTGTFITRLLQSGLIAPEDLRRKYRDEIHANEIVLLAYYIAAINIEAVYSTLTDGEYEPFGGICLTDTFQLYEKDDLVSGLLSDNSSRRARQKELGIRVVIANPPYSEGQESGNDDAANIEYAHLDQRIRDTFGARSDAGLQNSLFNSYIRAIRWASDRVGERGVVAFVSGAGWVSGNSFDGLRRCLAEECSKIFVFHLRGNARTKGLQRQKEKGNVFGAGSRSPIAITVMVKGQPTTAEEAQIFFKDIGDYLSGEEKLAAISDAGSVGGISEAAGWTSIVPDEHGDWLRQRSANLGTFLPLGSKKDKSPDDIFALSSSGLKTNRDPWCYNPSNAALSHNMSSMVSAYNAESDRYIAAVHAKDTDLPVEEFVDKNPQRIKWTRELFSSAAAGRKGAFDERGLRDGVYRPFSKEWSYFDRQFNNCVYQLPRLFPTNDSANRVILVSGPGSQSFSALMVDSMFNYDTLEKGVGFPRYLYIGEAEPTGMFARQNGQGDTTFRRVDAVTDESLAKVRAAYGSVEISKDDLFDYTYGMLHSEEYREVFADNLLKELPRIPLMATLSGFRAFVEAGRTLGELHVKFAEVVPYKVPLKQGDLSLAVIEDAESFYRVEKMKFGGKRPNLDKSIVIYNPRITMTNIPLEAYDYVVNGKPALEWVMERQVIKTDPASGLVNDANRYAIETVGNPAYPLELFQRVITVSLETMKIVRSLPALDIMPEPDAAASATH